MIYFCETVLFAPFLPREYLLFMNNSNLTCCNSMTYAGEKTSLQLNRFSSTCQAILFKMPGAIYKVVEKQDFIVILLYSRKYC